MYEKINDFIVGMVTTHDKGCLLVFITFVHIYIFVWEPIVHDHSGSKFEVRGGGDRYKKSGEYWIRSDDLHS